MLVPFECKATGKSLPYTKRSPSASFPGLETYIITHSNDVGVLFAANTSLLLHGYVQLPIVDGHSNPWRPVADTCGIDRSAVMAATDPTNDLRVHDRRAAFDQSQNGAVYVHVDRVRGLAMLELERFTEI